jgi:hypothetical protein
MNSSSFNDVFSVTHTTRLLVSTLYSVEKSVICELWCGKTWSWPNLEYYSEIYLEGLRKSRKSSVKKFDLWAEIWNWDLRNTRLVWNYLTITIQSTPVLSSDCRLLLMSDKPNMQNLPHEVSGNSYFWLHINYSAREVHTFNIYFFNNFRTRI